MISLLKRIKVESGVFPGLGLLVEYVPGDVLSGLTELRLPDVEFGFHIQVLFFEFLVVIEKETT